MTEYNEYNVDQHPAIVEIMNIRGAAAYNFAPEFSGQRFSDFDRGLLAAYEAVRKTILEGKF